MAPQAVSTITRDSYCIPQLILPILPQIRRKLVIVGQSLLNVIKPVHSQRQPLKSHTFHAHDLLQAMEHLERLPSYLYLRWENFQSECDSYTVQFFLPSVGWLDKRTSTSTPRERVESSADTQKKERVRKCLRFDKQRREERRETARGE